MACFEAIFDIPVTPTFLFDFTTNYLEDIKIGNLKLPKISKIVLSRNNLNKIPKDLRKLTSVKEIILNDNFIDSIDREDLRNHRKLKILDLSSNQITTLSDLVFKDLFVLQKLDLSSNLINTLHPRAFGDLNRSPVKLKLKALKLSNNVINQVPLYLPTELEELWLDGNEISQMSTNQLDPHDKNFMHAIKYLNLSSNHISQIENGTGSFLGQNRSF